MDVGMLGRFFGRLTGGNWRPPEQELRFAAGAGFDTVQIRSDRPGELEDELGIAPAALGELFDDIGLEPVLEMLTFHQGEPGTFARALTANLEAIHARDPELSRRIVLNMVSHMSGLLRMTTTLLRDASEAVD